MTLGLQRTYEASDFHGLMGDPRASEKLEHLGNLFLATNSLMHPLANSLVKYEDLSAT